MADVGLTLTRLRIGSAEARTSERFLTLPRAGAVAFFLLFGATFEEGKVHEDGLVYFTFLRRFFGASTPAAAYQFGSAVWNAPFYLVSQLVATRGGFDRFHAGEIGTAVASNVAVVATLYLGWRILRDLDLPRGPLVLLLTLFGTNLFFYGALVVSYKHAADTLYTTFTLWFVLRSSREGARRRDFLGAGAGLGLLLVTRYANVAFWIAILGVFALLRLRRAALWMLVAAISTSSILFGLAAIRHIPFTAPPDIYQLSALNFDGPGPLSPTVRTAMSPTSIVDPVWHNSSFGLTAPIKMLFTLRRGLFLWTPLTFFATLGLVLLLRHDRRHRPFLLALGASAAALVAIHVLWGGGDAWTGGGSFSQRFLTALFPVFLVGTAEFVRRYRRVGVAVLTLCASFSVWVGLVTFNGYYNEGPRDSLVQVVGAFHGLTGPPVSRYHKPPPYNSIENFGREMGHRISERWQLYWRIVT